MVENWRSQGYLAASLDTLYAQGLIWNAHLYQGIKWKSVFIQLDSIGMYWEAGRTPFDSLKSIKVNSTELVPFQKKLIKNLNAAGFAFAKAELTQWEFKENGIVRVQCIVTPGKMYPYAGLQEGDSLIIRGSFLESSFLLKKGEPFNVQMLAEIPKLVKRWPWCQLQFPPYISVINQRIFLRIPLKEQSANLIDFLLGIQRNANGKYTLSGNASLTLRNTFKYGEEFQLNYQQLTGGANLFYSEIGWPFLFRTPFHWLGKFSLTKQDSTWTTVQGSVGIKSILNQKVECALGLNVSNTALISIPKQFILNNRKLPQVLDHRNLTMYVQGEWNTLDDPLVPHSGWNSKIRFEGGLSQIRENANITNLRDPLDSLKTMRFLYDSLENELFIGKLNGSVKYYLSLKGPHVLHAYLEYNHLIQKRILESELYYAGGYTHFRGFDERSLPATIYGRIGLAYHLYFGPVSYLEFFGDTGRIEFRDTTENISSFGTGCHVRTGKGLLHILIAGGIRTSQPFRSDDIRIHLGYSSVF